MAPFTSFDRRRLAWGLFGLLLIGVLAMVVLPFLGTFAAAVFLYYAVRPAYERIDDWTSRPNVAATVTLLLVALPITVVVAYAAVVSAQNLDHLLQSADLERSRALLEPVLSVSDGVSNPRQLLSRISQRAGESPGSLFSTATAVGGTFFSVLLRLFLVFAFAFYFLRDDQKLSGWARTQLSTDGPSVFEEYADRVDEDLQSVYVGNLLNVFAISALAVVTNVGLNLLAPAGSAVPYPILVAVLTGIGSLVPAVGMKVVYVPVAAVLFASTLVSGGAIWVPIVYFAITLAIVDTIPDFVVRAYLAGTLHMGLVMFSYILGSVVFGWYGIFLGPFLLVVIYHFGDLVVPELRNGRVDA